MTNTTAQLPTTDADRILLLHAGLIAALDALRDISLATTERLAAHPETFSGLFHDDNEDYANAARDQIAFCSSLLADDELDSDSFDSIFTKGTDDLYNETDPVLQLAASFIYGYADHSSPISDLMLANIDTLDA